MLNQIALLLVAFLALATTPSIAAVGIKVDGVLTGTATDLNFQEDQFSDDGSTFTVPFLVAGAGPSGSVSMTTTDTAISTSYALVRKDVGVQVGLAGTLANGTPGQILTILITARAGSGTFLVTPTTKTGFTRLTFDAADEFCTLLYIDNTTGWVPIAGTSGVITQ